MRRYDDPYNDLGPSSPHQSCPDCIIAMRGYDFREGQPACHQPATAMLSIPRSSTAAARYHDQAAIRRAGEGRDAAFDLVRVADAELR
jgi:hypothetical protein